MTKIKYDVIITGWIEVETDELEDHELARESPVATAHDKKIFDIGRYLKLITSTIKQSHQHWKQTTSYGVTKKTVYDKRGIPTSEPVGGCC